MKQTRLITRTYRLTVANQLFDDLFPAIMTASDRAGIVQDKLNDLVRDTFGHSDATPIGYPRPTPWPDDWTPEPGFTVWEGKYAVLVDEHGMDLP